METLLQEKAEVHKITRALLVLADTIKGYSSSRLIQDLQQPEGKPQDEIAEYMTYDDAAKLFGISKQTLTNMVKAGQINRYGATAPLRRVRRDEIAAVLFAKQEGGINE